MKHLVFLLMNFVPVYDQAFNLICSVVALFYLKTLESFAYIQTFSSGFFLFLFRQHKNKM